MSFLKNENLLLLFKSENVFIFFFSRLNFSRLAQFSRVSFTLKDLESKLLSTNVIYPIYHNYCNFTLYTVIYINVITLLLYNFHAKIVFFFIFILCTSLLIDRARLFLSIFNYYIISISA